MSDARTRIQAVLDGWLFPLPPLVREGLLDDLEEIVDGMIADLIAEDAQEATAEVQRV